MSQQPYYQVWAHLEAHVKWTRILLASSLILMALLLFLFYLTLKKPVVVVRIGDHGQINAKWHSQATEEVMDSEAIDYAKEFLLLYLAPRSGEVATNLKRAAKMMSPALRRQHATFFEKSQYRKRVDELGVRSKLNIERMIVRREKKGRIDIYAAGIQQVQDSRGVAVFHPFQSMVRLREIKRNSMNPYGLEIADLDFELRKKQ